MVAGYSSRSLADKLGIKAGMTALVIGGVDSLISELPSDIELTSLKSGSKPGAKHYDYIHLFTTQQASLEQSLSTLKAQLEQNGMIWVSWPKKAAKKIANFDTDLTEDVIRDHALSIGLVDVKVCAIDEVWSGLKLVIPVKDRTKR